MCCGSADEYSGVVTLTRLFCMNDFLTEFRDLTHNSTLFHAENCKIIWRVSVQLMKNEWHLLSLSPHTFQTEQHHVREQLGSTHSAMGTHCSNTLHQHLAGHGRLWHHHYWLPWWTDLSLGHDVWSGGTIEVEGWDDYSSFISEQYVNFCCSLFFSSVPRFVPGPCCLVILPPLPVCLKPVHAVTSSI